MPLVLFSQAREAGEDLYGPRRYFSVFEWCQGSGQKRVQGFLPQGARGVWTFAFVPAEKHPPSRSAISEIGILRGRQGALIIPVHPLGEKSCATLSSLLL